MAGELFVVRGYGSKRLIVKELSMRLRARYRAESVSLGSTRLALEGITG